MVGWLVECMFVYSLGHFLSSQLTVWTADPEQEDPPNCGLGLVQDLDRDFFPGPQGFEQDP